VTIHGDFHGYNFLYADAKETKLRAIDLDTTWRGNPLQDMAYHQLLMNVSYKEKFDFAKAYLETRYKGKKATKKDIHNLLMDAELMKFWIPLAGTIQTMIGACGADMAAEPTLGPQVWQTYFKVWTEASKSQKETEELLKTGIRNYVYEHDQHWREFISRPCMASAANYLPGYAGERNTKIEIFEFDHWKNTKDLEKLKTDPFFLPQLMIDQHIFTEPKEWKQVKGGKDYGARPDPTGATKLFVWPELRSKKDKEEGNTSRFVLGGSRKSGYPYAQINGYLGFKTEKKNGKLQLKVIQRRWKPMMTPNFSAVEGGLMDLVRRAINAHFEADKK
jgi:hypothetical protein